MAFDVYQPCPFCTDKKLKFCCADIADEMEKVSRLSENGQNRVALKILEKLAVSHPNTVWNEAVHASLLIDDGRVDEARAILEKLHRLEPENQAVMAILATAAFGADGYHAAREVIWRAFRKASVYDDLVSTLALGIATEMFTRENYLSARQHLTLAMRLAPQRNKQAIFLRMLEFDSNAETPYPLRSVHSLRSLSGDADRQDVARKAMRLADRGCFGPAAERFVSLAQATPDDPAVEYNFALCAAWEDDGEVAAEAFGRAALAEPDFELAAEYAALEQFLRVNLDDGPVRMRTAEYRLSSVSASKLISLLDEHPKFARVVLPSGAKDPDFPDAVFDPLDRPMPEPAESLTPDQLPRLLGQLAIFGSSTDAGEPRVRMLALDGWRIDAAKAVVGELAAELELLSDDFEVDSYTVPRQLEPLHEQLAFPTGLAGRARRELQLRHREAMVEAWLDLPQEALLGKSPNQAKHDAGLRVPLAGAIYVLDAFRMRFNQSVDVDGLRQRLGLPPVPPIEVTADLPLNTLSAIQLHRLPVAKLDDRQLTVVLNRAMLVHHVRFLRDVLEEAIKRTLPELDRNKVFQTLMELARDRGDTAEALRWIAEGHKEVTSNERAFEHKFRWDSYELALRLEDPQAPDFEPFLRRIAAYYGPKIPQFMEQLDKLLQNVGITLPTILEPVGTATGAAAGGVWTPDRAGGGEEKKLWLPGT